MGHLERTLFELTWIQDPDVRRRVLVGLNKGERRNAVARAVRFNRGGEMHDRAYEDQQHRASGLNLIIAAIVLWNTVHLDRAVTTMRQQGVAVPDTYLPHRSPLHWDHILFTGDYQWNRQLKTNLEQVRPLPKKPATRGRLSVPFWGVDQAAGELSVHFSRFYTVTRFREKCGDQQSIRPTVMPCRNQPALAFLTAPHPGPPHHPSSPERSSAIPCGDDSPRRASARILNAGRRSHRSAPAAGRCPAGASAATPASSVVGRRPT